MDKETYIKELEKLLEYSEKELDLFIKEESVDHEHSAFLYNGMLQWSLRISQLKEKILDVKFNTTMNEYKVGGEKYLQAQKDLQPK